MASQPIGHGSRRRAAVRRVAPVRCRAVCDGDTRDRRGRLHGARAGRGGGRRAGASCGCTPLWNEVKRGFFTLTTSILLVLALAAWLSTRAAQVPGDEAGRWSATLALATAGRRRAHVRARCSPSSAPAARVAGIVSVAASVATLVAMAGTARQSYAIALFQLLAGAAFLGSITDGLLLGHWYLTDRGLSRGPIDRFTTAMLVSVVVEGVAVIVERLRRGRELGLAQSAAHRRRARAVDRARHGGRDAADRPAHPRRR